MLRAGVRVPDDLSVVGYDDSRFAALPGIDLTSVRQDIPKMARLAVKAAVERLERPTRVTHAAHPPGAGCARPGRPGGSAGCGSSC